MSNFTTFFVSILLTFGAFGQCDSITVDTDLIISSDDLMSGTYVVNGDFVIQSGVTVFVNPYAAGACGELKIYANNITINGTINGDYAGYAGGAGGGKGQSVSSITGHAASLTSCNDSGTEGHIKIEGGFGGTDGAGPGGGLGGANGSEGSGSKQYCGSFGDEAGLVGGAGGAGGGSGGSYGGVGAVASSGGAGTNLATFSDLDIEDSYGANAGNGGSGGAQSAQYGSLSGRDIQLGSGGAGAGGGARSFYLGSDGFDGGAGGGLVFLKATGDVIVDGDITVNGQNGSFGGNGGSGDATDDCCSDGCNGCDERTYSCGSGPGAGSGGGSGGGIFIECLGTANIQGTLSAKGGAGGASGQIGNGASCSYGGGGFCSSNSISTSDSDAAGEGGAGGGGRIKIYTLDCEQFNLSATIEVNGGTGANAGADGTYAEVCGYAGEDELNEVVFLWSMYPNPFDENLTVQLPETVNFGNPADLIIVDQLGKVVANYVINEQLTSINLDFLNCGIYFVKVQHNGQLDARKISKR